MIAYLFYLVCLNLLEIKWDHVAGNNISLVLHSNVISRVLSAKSTSTDYGNIYRCVVKHNSDTPTPSKPNPKRPRPRVCGSKSKVALLRSTHQGVVEKDELTKESTTTTKLDTTEALTDSGTINEGKTDKPDDISLKCQQLFYRLQSCQPAS